MSYTDQCDEYKCIFYHCKAEALKMGAVIPLGIILLVLFS